MRVSQAFLPPPLPSFVVRPGGLLYLLVADSMTRRIAA